jgi:hypothetical protein
MTPTIASFYTPTWEYPQHAARLRRECQILRLPHVIEERPDAGGYIANCRIKPVFLLETMRRVQAPLLWIDVDGSILRRPSALRPDVDFMARTMPWDRSRQWHVGTLFFNNTPGALDLLERWVAQLRDDSDEAALDRVWRLGHFPRVAPLPASYFHVLNGRQVQPDTVIAHRLSSSPAKMLRHR